MEKSSNKMKTSIYLIIFFTIVCNYSSFAQCVNGISTNYNNPINNNFNPSKENPFLNSFNVGQNYGLGFYPIDINDYAGWQINGWIQGSNIQMDNPFANGSVQGRPELYPSGVDLTERDFHWEDGWELLWLGTGYYPNGDPINVADPNSIVPAAFNVRNSVVPYIILYNRYTGIMRIFANLYHSFDDDDVKIEVSLGPLTSGGHYTGIFRHISPYDQPLDQVTKNYQYQSNQKTSGSISRWFSTDIQVGYDPCTCFNPSYLDFKFVGIDNSTLILEGRQITLQDQLFDANNKPIYQRDFLDARSIQEQEVGNIIYKRADKLLEDYQQSLSKYNSDLRDYKSYENDVVAGFLNWAKNGITAGFADQLTDPLNQATTFILGRDVEDEVTLYSNLDKEDKEKLKKNITKGTKTVVGKAYDFLTLQLIGKKPNKPVKPKMPVASYSELSFAGDLTGTTTLNVTGFLNPGSDNSQQGINATNYPAYDEVLGLFSLLKTPELVFYSDSTYNESKIAKYDSVDDDPMNHPYEGSLLKCHDYVYRERFDDFMFYIKEPLEYKLNPALDFDNEKTELSVAFILTFEAESYLTSSEENHEELHLNKLVNDFEYTTNFKIDHYTRTSETPTQIDLLDCPILPGGSPLGLKSPKVNVTKSKNIIEMSSKFYPMDKVNKIKFEGRLGKRVDDSQVDNLISPYLLDNIDGYTLVQDHLITKMPSKENFKNTKLMKVEMKIIADMYFDQLSTDGDQINTTQVFTYLLFDKENNVDHLSSSGLVINDPNIFINDFHSGTIYLEGNITPSHPAVTKINGNILYIDAEDVVVTGLLTTPTNNKLYVRSVGNIYFEDNGTSFIGAGAGGTGEIEFRQHNNLLGSNNNEASDQDIVSFCSSNSYNADQIQNRIHNDLIENNSEEGDLDKEEDLKDIRVFPNPSNGNIFVQFDSETNDSYRFKILDINGSKIIDESLKGQESDLFSIDLRKFQSGIYFLKIYDSNSQIGVKRIIKN